MLLFLLIACQEPFAVDRHDLVGDRVAAIELHEEGTGLRPRLALFDGGKPWSDAPPSLSWAFVSAGDDTAARGDLDVVATGASPLLEPTDGRLVLAVDWASGEQRHVIDLDEAMAPPTVSDIVLSVVELDAAEAVDLSLETREAWPTTGADFVPAEGLALLEAPSESTVRWMATSGDFLELANDQTHWWPGSMVRDEDELESVEPGEAGTVTVVAAAVAEGVRFTAADVHVDLPGDGLFTPSGRWIPTDTAVVGGLVQGTLEADDGAPSGVRLVVIGAVDANTDPGTATLCAEPHAGPFDPNWLLDGTCLRNEVVGATVVVEAR
ncbi:MAG: hypothetical protein EP330_02725 [Deltaproteobacteria bacterium]|nr:MAG: hypothetical protein EP330_02725 [Deltaproteobacteria bacterium]